MVTPSTFVALASASLSLVSGCTAEAVPASAEIKRAYPNEVVATFRVDGEVTLQALVSLIDVVRGEGCRLSRAEQGESVPAECLFWLPVVDVAP